MPSDAKTTLRLDEFARRYVVPPKKPSAAISHRKRTACAIRHLAAVIGREPTVGDLTDRNLKAIATALYGHGKAENTVARVATSLATLSRIAVENKLLTKCVSAPPQKQVRRGAPLTRDEIERILASCLNVDETIAGFSGSNWWLTLILLMINTGGSAEQMLLLPRSAWNSSKHTVGHAGTLFRLHTVTELALHRLYKTSPQTFAERLLPWTLDGGKPPFHGVYPRFKNIVQSAGVARKLVSPKLLTQAAQHLGSRALLEGVDLQRLADIAERLRVLEDAVKSPEQADRGESTSLRRRAADTGGSSDESLLKFVDEKYVPTRLPQSEHASIWWHRRAVHFLGLHLAREPRVDDLTTSKIEETMAYCVRAGKSTQTANHVRACLVAQWNLAHHRGILEAGPGDIYKYRVKKRVPVAWSLAEVEQILSASQSLEHNIYGVRAAVYWPALILLIYETGLRIGAVMKLRRSNLDTSTGWLTAPAEIQKQDADQVFELTPASLALIVATHPERREFLFRTRKYWEAKLQQDYRLLLQRANLPHGKKDKFHKLRRTSASYWAAKLGAQSASMHLGHSSLTVTNRYLDPKIVGAPKSIEVLPAPQWKRIVD